MKTLPSETVSEAKSLHLLLITKSLPQNLKKPCYNPQNIKHQELLSHLYSCYAPSLKLVILNLVPSVETVDDLLHDSFLKINKALHTYQPDRSQLLTWMKAIARNTTVDYLRMKRTKNTTLTQSIELSTNELKTQCFSSINTDSMGIKQLVKSLAPEQFSIIELIYFKGFTQDEAAQTLNIPLGTLKTRLRKALRQLRQLFN